MRRFLFLCSVFVLTGCASPEFKAAQSECASTWMRKIPAQYEKEMYNESRKREVPTGETTCTTVGNTVNCKQHMKTEYYTVPAVRTVDRNKGNRDAQIQACTRDICLSRYGNTACDKPK